ncbi:hypothetical protein [Dietzia sp. 179-F 9C3 NHS]|uniref:hypothetical protein n=1 Tax=Dietzia sp. 179-F 9C3 NHS TaxID=3374295 RepID=UPI00387A5817
MRAVPRRRTTLLACAVALSAAAGCSSDPEPEPPPAAPIITTSGPTTPTEDWPVRALGEPLPEAKAAQVDREDPEAVAVEALRIIYTRDTTREESSGQSFARAADLMTGKLRDELVIGATSARPSLQWSQWVAAEAAIAAEAEVTPEEHPADEPDLWRRVVEVREYVTAADGTRMGAFRSVHYADVRKEDRGWAVDAIQFGERQPADR